MRQVCGWMLLMVVCCTVGAVAGEEAPDERLHEAQGVSDEAIALFKAGKYAEAIAKGEQALVLREAALGGTHLDVARSLNDLALFYHHHGMYSRAEPLYQRALAIREVALGENHPDVATSLNNLAGLYMEQGLYTWAEPLLQRALAITEKALGKNHPDVANSLVNLARLYYFQGSHSRAEPLFQRALAIKEAALGKNHPDVAIPLSGLATFYMDQGKYSQAEPLAHRALTIREAGLGKNHPDVATPLINLANLYYYQGLYSRAEPLFQRVLAITENTLGKNHPSVATSLNNLAVLYDAQGLYNKAEPLFQRALAIKEAVLGKNHPSVATSLNNLASLYMDQGKYSQAEPIHLRALAIVEAALGKNHPDVATSCNNLANLYMNQGKYSQAEPLYQRALAIVEASLGKKHPKIAASLNSLANLYYRQGLYSRAEALYHRVLAITEEALGKHHPYVAYSLTALAGLYKDQGSYSLAEPLFQRALAIREVALGKNHPDVAASLNNLASLYMKQGLYRQAEPLFQRALAIWEVVFGKNHPDVATSLNSLASLYMEQGLYRQAEPLFQRALAIREVVFGKNHPHVVTSLNNLAGLYMHKGLYHQAEMLYQRALAIQEAALGKNHPDVATLLVNLGDLRLNQHRLGAAVPLFARAFTISEQRLRREALDFSEARLADFLQLLRSDEERLYRLLRAHPDNASLSRVALSAALLLKGRSVEELANISRAVYRGLGPEERETFERLREVRTQFARLSLEGHGSRPLAAYQQQLNALAEQGDALEATLAKSSASLRALAALPSPAEIVDRVAEALPDDGALVEFITYQDRMLIPNLGSPEPQLRYLAIVLWPDATLRALDLGPAEPIDRAASRLRDSLANRDTSFQAHSMVLYQLVFNPLLPLLGDTRRLFLSPEGQLSLVPFASLHDGHQFLLETFDFTYLTSGKDLLPRPQEQRLPSSVVVLADPDFSSPLQASISSSEENALPFESTSSLDRYFPSQLKSQPHRNWDAVPLPGTRQEAEAIQRLFPHAQLFLGTRATKQRLLNLPPPGILHLATHGFFLQDVLPLARSRAIAHFDNLGADAVALNLPDPLLRSGLLFAGAQTLAPSNPTQAPRDSALVTALELAGLNLWGTQLVVLSACDTGRGDIQLGQGVYGLRRAFLIAGAETVVMSLWKLNDDTTRHLMEAFYSNLLAGQSRATALRQAMRALRTTHPHPHYWAPFIVLGRDAPLHERVSSRQEPQKK